MKELSFYDLDGFCCEISQWFEKLDKEELEDISIIAKYDEARIIINELIRKDFNIHSIDLRDEDWEGYVDEYIISLINVGDGNELFCEPMKRDGKYIPDTSTITYVLGNCSSKVIPYCNGKTVYEVAIGDDEYDKCECSEFDSDKFVMYSKDEDGDMHGFTASKSDGNSYFGYSFYTSNTLSMDDIRNMLKEIGF